MTDRPPAPTLVTPPGPAVSADWWVSHGSTPPVGPVSTELLLSGIRAGVVPRESLVCKVGYREWQALAEVAPFAAEVTKPRGRFDPASERCRLDIEPLPPSAPAAVFAATIPLRRSLRSPVDKTPVVGLRRPR